MRYPIARRSDSLLPIDSRLDAPDIQPAWLSSGKHPITAIAEQEPMLAADLIDTLSRRDNETARIIARAESTVEVCREHCTALAVAVRERHDKDHFRVVHTDEEGHYGLFGRVSHHYRHVTTQLDMW